MKKVILLFLFICFALLYYAHFVAPDRLILRKKVLFLHRWSTRLNGLKVAFLSDIHFGARYMDLNKLNKIVDLVNKQNPDLILFAGDLDAELLMFYNADKNDVIKVLSRLNARYFKGAVLGNHDYSPPCIIPGVLEKSHFTVLRNKVAVLNISDTKLKIAGIDDIWYSKPDLNSLFSGQNDGAPLIFLSHNPDVFPKLPDFVSLTLSGHTHGGEISFPVLGSPFVPSKYAQRYRKGHVVENSRHLFVSSGIGTLSGFRFNNAPEVVILELRQETQKNKIQNTKPKRGFSRDYIPLIRKYFYNK